MDYIGDNITFPPFCEHLQRLTTDYIRYKRLATFGGFFRSSSVLYPIIRLLY